MKQFIFTKKCKKSVLYAWPTGVLMVDLYLVLKNKFHSKHRALRVHCVESCDLLVDLMKFFNWVNPEPKHIPSTCFRALHNQGHPKLRLSNFDLTKRQEYQSIKASETFHLIEFSKMN